MNAAIFTVDPTSLNKSVNEEAIFSCAANTPKFIVWCLNHSAIQTEYCDIRYVDGIEKPQIVESITSNGTESTLRILITKGFDILNNSYVSCHAFTQVTENLYAVLFSSEAVLIIQGTMYIMHTCFIYSANMLYTPVCYT